MIKILVVEDDISISEMTALSLKKSGYSIERCMDGIEACSMIENNCYDLILLDVMLPGLDGFEVFDYIKDFGVPVIFITAKSQISDRVKGLRMGAEDYIVKPFDIAELLARVETVLRRYRKTDHILSYGDIVVDTDSHSVKKSDIPVELTLKEYEMLLFLIRNKGIALYRETIYEHVWNESYMGDTRTVDLHIQRLRKKLGLSKEIESVYKVGYRLK